MTPWSIRPWSGRGRMLRSMLVSVAPSSSRDLVTDNCPSLSVNRGVVRALASFINNLSSKASFTAHESNGTETSLRWASFSGSQYYVNPHLLLSADACRRYRLIAAAGTRRPQQSIDICCPRQRSAANQPHAAAAVDQWGRRMDWRTDTRPLHRYCTAYFAGRDKNSGANSSIGI